MSFRVRQRGVTLIELMITLAVAVVLISLAVPSYRSMTLANKLDTAANDVVGAVRTARMEAIKRNGHTQLCSNTAAANTGDTLGAACGTEAGAVWALNGAAATQVLAGPPGLVAPLQFNGAMTALRFGAQGLAQKVGAAAPYDAVVADICTSQTSTNNHRVIRMAAGSIVTTTTTSGACPST